MPTLTPDEAATIKSTVPILAEHGNTITTTFYKNVLRDYPALNNMFNTANQVNNHQAHALASALHAYASQIDNLSALEPALELMCHKHASLGVQPAHYEIVGTYLLAAMHQVLGAALPAAVAQTWEKAYWQLADVLIGREASLYQSAGPWTSTRPFTVQRKEPVTPDITSFYLVPTDDGGSRSTLPPFAPGQYVSVQLPVPRLNYLQARQYSLSAAPGLPYYRITVKREAGLPALDDAAAVRHPGYVSNLLHDAVREGDVVHVSHPFGDFALAAEDVAQGDDGPPLVLIGGGVGVTPLLAMLGVVLGKGAMGKRPVTLVHTAPDEAARPYHAQLVELQRAHDNFQCVFFDSRAATTTTNGMSTAVTNGTTNGTSNTPRTFAGRMDLAALKALDNDKAQRSVLWLDDRATKYFVCGPTALMLSTQRTLKAWGVDESRIRLELFGTGISGLSE